MRSNHDRVMTALAAALLVSACASSEQPSAPLTTTSETVRTISSLSCPEGVDYLPPTKQELTATPLSFSNNADLDVDAFFAPLKPVALFELTSSDPLFGGLSGLDFLDDDTLIFASDMGTLFWIDVDPETSVPADTAFSALLRDETGQPFNGKSWVDSEGVSWTGEMLYVSFEREHRVLAYDIDGCGAFARGIELVSFDSGAFGIGTDVSPNSGLEALGSRGTSEFILGLEERNNGAPVAIYKTGEESDGFAQRLRAPELTMQTGTDLVEAENGEDRLYSIFRSYDPLRGNRIAIAVSSLSEDGLISETQQLTMLTSEVVVDNFEGIAVRPVSDTTDRIVIVSDDNFSDRQKTLLAVFDHDHSAGN